MFWYEPWEMKPQEYHYFHEECWGQSAVAEKESKKIKNNQSQPDPLETL